MRAAIVGCGKQCGWTSANIARYFDGIDWVDTNIENAKRFYDIHQSKQEDSSYGSEIKTSNIGIAIILTPNGTHKQVAEKFIENNIPVFIEKPLALSWEDLEWFENAEKNGAWITTGFQCRFNDSILGIKNELKVNPPVIIDCWKHREIFEEYYEGWHGTWKYDGGVMTQQGIHAIDIVCFIVDEVPRTISMMGGNFKNKFECEDTALLSLQYDNFVATIHMTTAMGMGKGLYGGHSGLFVSTKLGGFCSAQGFSFEQISNWKDLHTNEPKKYFNIPMWSEILDAVHNKWRPPVPVSESVKSMKIAHAAYASFFDKGVPKEYGTKFDLLGK